MPCKIRPLTYVRGSGMRLRLAMRYLAVGDIHGCFAALTTLAEYVPFKPDDMLITVGDVVDRGPRSDAVVSWLINYRQRARHVALRGNHEVMMLSARANNDLLDYWRASGGDATLKSYSELHDYCRLTDIPDTHWDFIEKETRPWHEIDTHFFVHANAYSDCALDEQPDHKLYWEPFDDPPPHINGKIMVCGHTTQASGRPRNIGHAVCIDTAAYDNGWLTCLDVKSGKYWQANERGETRWDWLEEVL